MKPLWSALALVGAEMAFASMAHAAVLASTDFSDRTVSGLTASDITWTTSGITDPGDLTAVGGPALFDTANAQDHFAPDRNTGNEGPWTVEIPLSFAASTAGITVSSVVIDWQFFNNSGAFQPVGLNRPTTFTATVVGSSSGMVDTAALSTGSTGASGTGLTLTFDSPPSLDLSETWKVSLTADGDDGNGNNTGLNALTINGDITLVPEPSALVLGLAGSLLLLRRRRQPGDGGGFTL